MVFSTHLKKSPNLNFWRIIPVCNSRVKYQIKCVIKVIALLVHRPPFLYYLQLYEINILKWVVFPCLMDITITSSMKEYAQRSKAHLLFNLKDAKRVFMTC